MRFIGGTVYVCPAKIYNNRAAVRENFEQRSGSKISMGSLANDKMDLSAKLPSKPTSY
jgi:hypothetical protein